MSKCLNDLEDKICLVDAAAKGDLPADRKCLPTPKTYKEKVLDSAVQVPEKLQPIFCHITKIFIEKNLNTTAYAGPYTERVPENDIPGSIAFKHSGWMIGLSEKNLFLSGWGLNEFLVRKDLTLFGRDLNSEIPKEFPRIEIFKNGKSDEALFLYDVLMHEIGHLVDMSNEIIDFDPSPCLDPEFNWIPNCKPISTGVFSTISWGEDGQHRSDVKFFDRPLCFYGDCRHEPLWYSMSLDQADSFYQELIQNGHFVSTYAPMSPREDFAESFAYYFLLKDPATEWTITFPSGNQKISMGKGSKNGVDRQGILAKLNFIDWLMKAELKFENPYLGTRYMADNSPTPVEIQPRGCR